MQDTIERDTQAGEIESLIAQGAIRKALGLKSTDLRLGLDVARNQLLRGATSEALRTYAALVVCDPSDPELQVGLANCALQMGESSLALQAASAVVALTPRDPRGYFLSGRACLALGFAAEAKEDLTEAMEAARRAKDVALFEESRKLLDRLSALGR